MRRAFVPAQDPDAWATELAAILHDAPARKALGAAGRARAAGYTWDLCAKRTRALYREVLNR